MSAAVAPPFRAERLGRELALDAALRYGAVLALVGVCLAAARFPLVDGLLPLAAIVGATGVWFWMNLASMHAARALQQVSPHLARDPRRAENVVGDALRKPGLQRWVRLMLYHRLAVLRLAQGRAAECAWICHELLSRPLGAARGARPHLLLTFAEATLAQGDGWAAYAALSALHRERLELGIGLSALAVQGRYHVAFGAGAAEMPRIKGKVEAAEMLAGAAGARRHAVLARASRAAGRERLARWLSDRARVLGGEEAERDALRPEPAQLASHV